MPIDEAEMTAMLLKLNNEAAKIRVKTLKIERVMMAFQSIMERKQNIQNETTGEISEKVLPIIDPGTGKPMKPTRKQEIYDANMIEAKKILSITT